MDKTLVVHLVMVLTVQMETTQQKLFMVMVVLVEMVVVLLQVVVEMEEIQTRVLKEVRMVNQVLVVRYREDKVVLLVPMEFH